MNKTIFRGVTIPEDQIDQLVDGPISLRLLAAVAQELRRNPQAREDFLAAYCQAGAGRKSMLVGFPADVLRRMGISE